LKGDTIRLVFEDQRHGRNPLALVFLMTGFRFMQATLASMASISRCTAA
jgi:hypothetical protein